MHTLTHLETGLSYYMRRAGSFCKNKLARLKELAHFQLRPCNKEEILTLFKMGIFWAAHGWGEDKKAPQP